MGWGLGFTQYFVVLRSKLDGGSHSIPASVGSLLIGSSRERMAAKAAL
jgi:hypothetical protein